MFECTFCAYGHVIIQNRFRKRQKVPSLNEMISHVTADPTYNKSSLFYQNRICIFFHPGIQSFASSIMVKTCDPSAYNKTVLYHHKL